MYVGRHRGIPRHLRLCSLCSFNMLEDEYHFLLVCAFYSSLRDLYIDNFYVRNSSRYLLNVRMSKTDDHSFIEKVARYVYFAFEKRKQLLNR